MSERKYVKGDFGAVRRQLRRDQIVGIFDLVGFTDADSNDELLAAVKAMETQIGLVIEREDYAWDERERGGRSFEAKQNEILIRSTGDGYIIAFSQADKSIEVLQCLTEIHKGIGRIAENGVKLGINKGANYVLMDMCDRVNIIGWGINYAARALSFAEKGQIICTEYLAKPLIEEHGDIFLDEVMMDVGVRKIKNTELHLYNYHKEGDFGSPLSRDQNE